MKDASRTVKIVGILCVFAVITIYPSARHAVNPIPANTLPADYCACYSGSPCECPGG